MSQASALPVIPSQRGVNAHVIGWAGILALSAAGALILCLATRKIWFVDFWWLWKTGQHVVEHGVPHTDVFSYTNLGQPRLEVRWGFAWALYRITDWLGFRGVGVFSSLIVLATFAFAAAAAPWKRAPVLTGVVLVIAALAASQRFHARPETVSYLFFALYVWVIERARTRSPRWLALMPLVQVAWANVHGLFLLGPALCGAWLVADGLNAVWRKLRGQRADAALRNSVALSAGMVGLTLAASLVNPYGYRLLALPLLQLSALHGTVQKDVLLELRSPFLFSQDWTALRCYYLLIALCVLALLSNLKRQQLFWLIVIASQFYLSATAIRNIPLFCIVAVPFAVQNILEGSLFKRVMSSRLSLSARAAVSGLLTVFVLWQGRELMTNRFNIRQGDTNQFGLGIADHLYPIAAGEFLQSSGAHGRLFNTLGAGSYLIALGYQVFVDPRGEEHMHRTLAEHREITHSPEAFRNYANLYGFQIAFVETSHVRLIEFIQHEAEWRMVYADSEACILFRDEIVPHIPALDLARDGAQWHRSVEHLLQPPAAYESRGVFTRLDSSAPYLRLANLLFSQGQYPLAAKYYAWAHEAYPPAFDAFFPLAYSSAQSGDWPSAAVAYLAAVQRSPDDRLLRLRAGVALVNAQRAADALAIVAPLSGDSSTDHEALAVYGGAALMVGQLTQAESAFNRAIAQKPQEPAYHKNLAKVLASMRRMNDAFQEFELAWNLAPTDAAMAIDAANLAVQLGQREMARKWLQRARELWPDDPRIEALQRAIENSGN